MSWIALTTDDVLSEFTLQEASSLRNLQGSGSGSGAPFANIDIIVINVIDEVRGYIIAGGYDVDPTDDKTIPAGLFVDAIAIARWRVLISTPMLKQLQTEERRQAFDKAIDKLLLIANRKFTPEPIPDTIVVPRGGNWNSENKLLMRTHPVPPPESQFPPITNEWANPIVLTPQYIAGALYMPSIVALRDDPNSLEAPRIDTIPDGDGTVYRHRPFGFTMATHYRTLRRRRSRWRGATAGLQSRHEQSALGEGRWIVSKLALIALLALTAVAVEAQTESVSLDTKTKQVKNPVVKFGSGNTLDCTGATVTNCGSGGGGSGTVTSFSAGLLSPLFTTSVATSTTTPALSFSLSNASAHKFFGNNTGSTAAPGFQSIGTGDLPDLSATYVPTSRTISTTSPITGGGDLTANRTFAIPCSNVDGY